MPLTAALTDALKAHRHLRAPLLLYRDDGTPMRENTIRTFVDSSAWKAQLRERGAHAPVYKRRVRTSRLDSES